MIHLARVRSKPSAWARCLALTLVALPLTTIAAARAQEVVATPNPDADRLADVVRRLGSAPRDLPALIEAGELSFTLGDATAAAAFYKRAEAIDPNNGRVKAGIARILVNGERPGEALRFFEQAQRHGATMARYADDRGLAYDLIGEQERAQQDYRLALSQGGRDAAELDEIRRRYALSLGISGKQDEALAQIDALLRHSDRGAWRARAFILAMNGDVAGANKIAGSMMPRGMAGGLAAFFQRLPSLSPADRAFAVHFGEVTPTAARLADARAVPPLAPLVVSTRVQVAATPTVQPAPAPQRLSRSEQRRRDRAARAAAAAPRTAVASATPVVSAATPTSAPAPPQLAQSAPIPAVPRDLAPTTTQPAFGSAPTRMAQSAPVPAVPRDPGSTTTQPGFAAAPTRMAQASPAPVSPVAATRAPPVQMVQALPTPTPTPTPTPAPAPTQLAAAVTTAPVPRPARHIAAPPARAIPPRISEDSILARIVAGISVPAAELGVAPMPGGQRVPLVAAPPAPVAATLDEAARTAERNAAADEQKRPRLAAAKRVAQKSPVVVEEEAKLDRKVRGKAVVAKKDVDEAEETLAAKPLDRKARGKALTGKKDVAAADDEPAAKPLDRKARAKALAAEKAKKDAAAKEVAEKKAARAEPERIWVQIASGANAADLPKAWKGAQDKADALGGKRAYTVQNRATNRLVTGPFKTEAEARAMVNTLKKQGLSAFSFTSDAGQKMTRLGGK